MARKSSPIDALVARGAKLIRAGKLVAFPTETVYGLGANALDEAAVNAIFEAKRRPATSPLIVHVDSVEMARSVAAEWPESAARLAARFWPGPLTLVLAKQDRIPDRVTAGLDTVGVRMPAHPIALALIRAARVPIAAPSANPFTGLSPTEARHVSEALGDRVAMVLDGGPSRVGLESTVLSLAHERAVLLRPGMISRQDLEEVIGAVEIGAAQVENTPHPAPGMHRHHYSPRTPLKLATAGGDMPPGRGVFLYLTAPGENANARRMPADAAGYAAVLYATLHELDAQGWDWIAVESPPNTPEWAAILDRLRRAATLGSEDARRREPE